MVRLNPLPHENVDDFSTYRVFGNLTAYNPADAKISNNGEVDHGLVAKQGDTQALTLEFIQSWLDRFTDPYKLTAGKLIWASQFKVNERIVNGYRRDRAFLIGGGSGFHAKEKELTCKKNRCCALPLSSWWTWLKLGTTRW